MDEENQKLEEQQSHLVQVGQCSASLQQSIKGELEFDVQSKVFNIIWLLEKAKLISMGVAEKANKYYNLLKAMMVVCNVCQGQNESNNSFRKHINAVVLAVNLVGGDDMLYSRSISNVSDPDNPGENIEVHLIVLSGVSCPSITPPLLHIFHFSFFSCLYAQTKTEKQENGLTLPMIEGEN